MSAKPLKVLVIDDDEDLTDAFAEVLRLIVPSITAVQVAYGGVAGVDTVATEGPFDVVITDLSMPTIDGFKVGALIKASDPGTRLVAVSGDMASVETAGRHPSFDFAMRKPVDIDALVRALNLALAR